MTAHKHAEMIKAKADNMDLVVFGNAIGGEWRECTFADLTIATGFYEFFLCLPQHKEAALNVLNGGESQVNYGECWAEANCNVPVSWCDFWWYMSDKCESRIKPRKEKRWIALNSFGDVMPVHCEDLESAKQLSHYKDIGINGEIQYVEIEIEV